MTPNDGADEEPGGDSAAWRVGTATRVITPERPMLLAGYGDRTEPSTGAAMDLHAKALAVEDDAGSVAVLVGIDVLGVTRDLHAAVADRCERAYDLAPDSLLLNASHTHHGPEYRVDESRLWDAEGSNDRRAREYRERLEDELVGVVGAALEDRAAAALRYSHGRSGFGMNRRRPGPDGFDLASYPDGPVDTDVPVLVATSDGSVRAILFGYACHPTSRPKQRTFHPDWPGVAAAELEERFPAATALFLQGCSADQNPVPRRTEEITEQHGLTAANAVEAAIGARGTPVHGPLRTLTEETTLEFEAQPDRDELERRLDESDGEDMYARRFLDVRADEGEIRTEFSSPVQAIGFGTDLTLVTLPGEVPVRYAHRIRNALAGNAWVAAYSNHGYVYIPTARQLYEGGYEASWVFIYWDYPAPAAPANEDRMTETALALAQRTGATRRDDRE